MNSLMCKYDLAEPVGPKEGGETGPTVYLNAEQAKAFFGKDVPKVSENYATGIQFTVKSVTKRENGLEVQIELTKCESCEGAEETEAGGED